MTPYVMRIYMLILLAQGIRAFYHGPEYSGSGFEDESELESSDSDYNTDSTEDTAPSVQKQSRLGDSRSANQPGSSADSQLRFVGKAYVSSVQSREHLLDSESLNENRMIQQETVKMVKEEYIYIEEEEEEEEEEDATPADHVKDYSTPSPLPDTTSRMTMPTTGLWWWRQYASLNLHNEQRINDFTTVVPTSSKGLPLLDKTDDYRSVWQYYLNKYYLKTSTTPSPEQKPNILDWLVKGKIHYEDADKSPLVLTWKISHPRSRKTDGEVSSLTKLEKAENDIRPCADNFLFHCDNEAGVCFRVMTQQVTWSEAQAECHKLGPDVKLLSLEGHPRKAQLIRKIIEAQTTKSPLSYQVLDYFKSDFWTWKPDAAYHFNLMMFSATCSNSQHCLYFFTSRYTLCGDCDELKSFICEKPLC